MRMVFGVLSLLMVLLVVGLLARTQLTTSKGIMSLPPATGASAAASAPLSPAQQSQQIQQQVKQAVEASMQQARSEPDDK